MHVSFFSVVFEISKIGMVYQCLNFLQNNYLIVEKRKQLGSNSIFTRFQQILNQVPLSKNQIIKHVVRKPLYEEFFFRICVQGGIFLIQRRRNRNKKTNVINLRIQKIFRIIVSALLFGLSHFIYQPLTFHQMKNVAWICLTGVVYGYVSENRRSMSESYLIHGINNALCCAKILHPQKEAMLKNAIYLSYLGLLFLFGKEICNDFREMMY
ncbi:MAG: CPBP family intramembrane metalloprotease [Parachlamydiaceae bacterium]|nr:CPBP family intramembrane metalloprotease [Parachlamydiaceae bacterium]